VFPEDGSQALAAWYSSYRWAEDTVDLHVLSALLKAEGTALADTRFDYAWTQDVALFTANGTLLLQAPMPDDPDILVGLTEGVLNRKGGLIRTKRLTAQDARRAGLAFRRMRWTFVEGGELITGRYRDGRTYAIMDRDAAERTRAFHFEQTGKEISETRARALVAKDLGIEPADLYFVDSGAEHLDTVMMALPGGRLLLQDSRLSAAVLRSLLRERPPREEKRLLAKMLRQYETRKRPDPALGLRKHQAPPSRQRLCPYDPAWEAAWLDGLEAALRPRFRVIRVAGSFKSLPDRDGGSGADEEGACTDEANFLNGFLAADRTGRLSAFTNAAHGLPSLERYWREVLKEHGIPGHRVHFLGTFDEGAGLDCAGALSGERQDFQGAKTNEELHDDDILAAVPGRHRRRILSR